MTTPERPQTGEQQRCLCDGQEEQRLGMGGAKVNPDCPMHAASLAPASQDRWMVNVANSGWTVSLHTEDTYTEFVMYTRHEADELADYLNASLDTSPYCDKHPVALKVDDEHWVYGDNESTLALQNILYANLAPAAQDGGGEWPSNREINEAIAPAAQMFSQQHYESFMRVMTRMSDAHNALTTENAALRARLELAEGVADEVIANLERVGKGEYERGKQEADAALRARAEQAETLAAKAYGSTYRDWYDEDPYGYECWFCGARNEAEPSAIEHEDHCPKLAYDALTPASQEGA